MPRVRLVSCKPCRMWHPPDQCPNTVACPTCHQPAGRRCERPSGHKVFGEPHALRLVEVGITPGRPDLERGPRERPQGHQLDLFVTGG